MSSYKLSQIPTTGIINSADLFLTSQNGESRAVNFAVIQASLSNSVTSVAGRTGAVVLSVSDVSGAAPLASPALTGTPTAPTPTAGDSSTKLATTAFVIGQAATTTPLVAGTATAGTSTYFARADHVHPVDTDAYTAGAGLTKPTSSSFAIANNGVTNAMMATMPGTTIKGNLSGSSATPTDISLSALTSSLNVATLSSFGVVKPDGTTITVANGVISAVQQNVTDSARTLFIVSSTTGVYDWNDATNTKAGAGPTLLNNVAPNPAANGPGAGGYYYPLNITLGSANGNLFQFALPYGNSSSNTNGPYFRTSYSGAFSIWYKMWHSGNDGATSGLDADLLDGQQGSFYAPIASPTLTGTVIVNGSSATTPVVLGTSGTIPTDASLSNVFSITLTGNSTLANPTNLTNGQTIVWRISQNSTGNFTLAYDTMFDFGSADNIISSTASSVNILTGVYFSDTGLIYCSLRAG